MAIEIKKLHLMALDEADLEIISAAAQDALFLPKEILYKQAALNFTLPIQRFCHENDGSNEKGQRVWSLLSFHGVLGVKAKNVAPKSNIPKSILHIKFVPDEAPPSGNIIITLAEGAELSLYVECLDIILGDIGDVRVAIASPNHNLD